MNINVKTIPHNDHRYPTLGDYWFTGDDKQKNGGDLEVRVSDTGDWRMDFLIAVHEMVEVVLLKNKGVAEPDIMAFDQMFEKEREQGLHTQDDEPGDDPRAPYLSEHRFAENIERQIALALGITWDQYADAIAELEGD